MSQENLTTDEAQAAWNELASERTAEPTGAPAPLSANEFTPADAPLPAAPEPEIEQVAPVAQEPVAAEPQDPFAGLPPAVRDRLAKLDELETRFAQREREFGAAIGRVAALQREVETAKKLAPQLSTGPTQAEIAEAAKSPEKWEAMKVDFPDLGEAIDERLTQLMAGFRQPQAPGLNPAQIDELVNTRMLQERTEMAKALEEIKVDIKHPDWRERANTPDFAQWFEAQDRNVKDLAASTKSADAIKLFDLFAQVQAKPIAKVNQDRQAKLAAAATTRPGQTPPPKVEDEMNPSELWNYLAKKRVSA